LGTSLRLTDPSIIEGEKAVGARSRPQIYEFPWKKMRDPANLGTLIAAYLQRTAPEVEARRS
jgi:hypothetical protein